MEIELVGVWSAEALYGLGGQSDEILVFKPDQTGWFEVINYHQWSADFFEWVPTSPGWAAFTGIKHIEPHEYKRKIIKSHAMSGFVHTSYQVQEEDVPSGEKMKVLRIQLLDEGHGAYGLISSNPGTRTEPTGQIFNLLGAVETARTQWNAMYHGGKDYMGSVMMRDNNSRLWEVKVRLTDYRKRYLKIKLKSDGSQMVRASADGYKPGKYLRITPDEWCVFACLAEAKNEPEYHARAQNILNRLV